MLARVNVLQEVSKSMAEELGREAKLSELAERMKMTEDEVRDHEGDNGCAQHEQDQSGSAELIICGDTGWKRVHRCGSMLDVTTDKHE
ncbi:MAG: sigma-70 domain-containing protein [Pilosibacter sp.]